MDNLNKVILTGLIGSVEVYPTYAIFILKQTAYSRPNEVQSKKKYNEYKVVTFKDAIIQLIKDIKDEDNIAVLLSGYVSQTDKKVLVAANPQPAGGALGGALNNAPREDVPMIEVDLYQGGYNYVLTAQDITFLKQPKALTDDAFERQLLSFNNVFLIGNSGNIPETKDIKKPDGEIDFSVVTFNLATNMSFRNPNGEKNEATTWHRISMFLNSSNKIQGLAKIVTKNVVKGSKLLIISSLRPKSWIDRNGEEKKGIEVVLQNNSVTLSIMSDRRGRGEDDNSFGGNRNSYENRVFNRNDGTAKKKDYSSEYDMDDLDDEKNSIF